MKVLQFTIPVAHDKSVIANEVELPYHYPYLHRHKEIQLTWIERGSGTLIAGNNMHAYSAGNIFFLGPNQPHLFKSSAAYFDENQGMKVKALSIFFNPEGVLSATLDLPEMKTVKQFLKDHEHGFKIPEACVTSVLEAMHDVKNAAGPEKLIGFIKLLNRLVALPVKLDALSGYGRAAAISENEGIRIGNIYNFIMQRYNGHVMLEDVAQAACMTPESFCRYFKKHTGQTFKSFLNEVRINEACKKLTSYKFENISDVAYSCGFQSITNFNRVFKSISGSSPREYLDNYSYNINTLEKAAV